MATSPRRFDGESDDDASDEKPPTPAQQPAVTVSRVLDVGGVAMRRPVAPAFEVAPRPTVPAPAVPPPPSEAAFDDGFFDNAPEPIPRSVPPPPPQPSMTRPPQRPTLQATVSKSSESLWDSVEALLDEVDAGFGAIMGDSPPMTTRDGGARAQEPKPAVSESGGLSDADIKAMVREAEANAGADKVRRAFIEAKNHADGLVHQVRKDLAEHGGTMPAADRAAAEAAILAVLTAMEGTDADRLRQATDALAQVAMRIGPAAAGSSAGAGTPDGKPDNGVVDAEFEEVADHKRSA